MSLIIYSGGNALKNNPLPWIVHHVVMVTVVSDGWSVFLLYGMTSCVQIETPFLPESLENTWAQGEWYLCMVTHNNSVSVFIRINKWSVMELELLPPGMSPASGLPNLIKTNVEHTHTSLCTTLIYPAVVHVLPSVVSVRGCIFHIQNQLGRC